MGAGLAAGEARLAFAALAEDFLRGLFFDFAELSAKPADAMSVLSISVQITRKTCFMTPS
jgi:hypothetical protein